ncbi:MAG: acyl carrier protein [Thermodesulfobacteriota bacterium]|nr:acyl carrier protein [Thermodesulfobacteriota bacterium]
MDDKEIFLKVKEGIVEALGVDEEEVIPNAVLFDDLGAESIDLLDIIFRIEKTFGIQIPRGGIQDEVLKSGKGLKEEDLAVDGVLTPLGIKKLKEDMPEVDPERITEGFRSEDIPTLFTVQTFVNLVKKHMAKG